MEHLINGSIFLATAILVLQVVLHLRVRRFLETATQIREDFRASLDRETSLLGKLIDGAHTRMHFFESRATSRLDAHRYGIDSLNAIVATLDRRHFALVRYWDSTRMEFAPDAVYVGLRNICAAVPTVIEYTPVNGDLPLTVRIIRASLLSGETALLEDTLLLRRALEGGADAS